MEVMEVTESQIINLTTLDNFLSEKDNSENSYYASNIPQACKDCPCVLGIDEAGRGPVLGPMVYGTAFCPLNQLELLEILGCADSKTLNEQTREKIFQMICDSSAAIGWAVEIISPNTISNSMLSRNKYSLNQLSMDAAIKLIRSAISAGVNLAHIYVDTVGPPEKYQEYLLNLFPDYKITVAKKADSTYSVVSAASICAKVVRDHVLSTWVFQNGIDAKPKDFGSGYPNDPLTKKFMLDYCDPVFGYPPLVRFSWSTASNILDERAYHIVCDKDEDEQSKQTAASSNTTITSFFKLSHPPKIKAKHEFFAKRCLSNTVDL